jgi:hypothetical protein
MPVTRLDSRISEARGLNARTEHVQEKDMHATTFFSITEKTVRRASLKVYLF